MRIILSVLFCTYLLIGNGQIFDWADRLNSTELGSLGVSNELTEVDEARWVYNETYRFGRTDLGKTINRG